MSILALFYGSASTPALQSIPAARSLSSYDWTCEELSQSAVDEVVDAMHADMLAKAPSAVQEDMLCSLYESKYRIVQYCTHNKFEKNLGESLGVLIVTAIVL